ncbi:MAG: hypothetical protein AAFW75_18625, partial [Cyanobacteria bacterium J06636_16]
MLTSPTASEAQDPTLRSVILSKIPLANSVNEFGGQNFQLAQLASLKVWPRLWQRWRFTSLRCRRVFNKIDSLKADIDIDDLEVLAVDANTRSATLRLPPATVSVNLNVARSESLANYRKW